MPKSFGAITRAALGFLLLVLPACDQMSDPNPAQPIQFSHKVHAADNQIPCMYCHQMADKSAVATVPSVGTCINCHAFVPGTQNPAEVAKVKDAWEKKETIQWAKVHDVPDFVHFPHKNHVRYFTTCAQDAAAAGEADLGKACGLNPNQNFSTMAKPFTDAPTPENIGVQSQFFACSQCHGAMWEKGTAQRVEPLNMGWCVDCHKNRIAKAPVEQQEALHGRMLDCWTCHK